MSLAKSMEPKRIHNGYEIILAVDVGADTEIVLGENLSNIQTPYATWTCYNGSKYQWCHAYKRYHTALRDFGRGLEHVAAEAERQLYRWDGRNCMQAFFTQDDCLPAGSSCIRNQVIVVGPQHLKHPYRNATYQLYLAAGGPGTMRGAQSQEVIAYSLVNGEQVCWDRRQILGVLKPELLPEQAGRRLGKVRRALKTQKNLTGGDCSNDGSG